MQPESKRRFPLSSSEPTSSGGLISLPVAPAGDAELVQGILAGRPAAVAQLIDRYSAVVRRILIRTLGNARDIEDLAQDTFLTVLRRCPTLRDPNALRSFIVSVAIRTARNELRKRAIRRFVGLDEAIDVPVQPPHDAEVAERVRHVYAALDKVDADARIAFVLRHVEGLDLAETAAASDCSLATVKRRLARAELRLRALAKTDPVLRGLLPQKEVAS